jgi:hypothetical protein
MSPPRPPRGPDQVLASINLVTGPAAAALLRDGVERCARGAPEAIAVFDLDSTLLDNRPRQSRILREFGALNRIAALGGAAPDHWESWDFTIAMANAGMSDEDIARWSGEFRAFWLERFFTSEYCADDVAIAGAPAYVHAVAAAGGRVCYVTGRHEPMRDGTLRSMRAADMPAPDGGRIQLLMKPTFDESDDAYKARTHDRLRDHGRVALAFDNEPTHVNDYRTSFPDALVIHLATDHSMRPVYVDRAIPSIADFAAFVAS